MAPHLGVSPAYKPDGVTQVQPRLSMVMSGDGGAVPYNMMPQLATLQIGSSVSFFFLVQRTIFINLCFLF